MPPRIAIPEPTSDEPEYNARALPQYISAIKKAGAEPVVVHLADTRERMTQLLAGIDGVLLPGSGHDVDPARYGESRAPECATDDPVRAVADELLLTRRIQPSQADSRHLPRRANAERVARRFAHSGFENARQSQARPRCRRGASRPACTRIATERNPRARR